MEYFIGLMDGVPTTANFSYYEGLVRGAWKMYQAGVLGHKMGERLTEKSEKIIGETITALCDLEEKDCVCEFDLKDALVDLYEELHQDAKEITGIETGYTSLNKMTCGLQEGDFVVLGARPSMGKTAFALNVGLHAAKSGAAVGLFSLEMSSKQLLKRMACVGEVSGGRLKNPKHRFAMEDWEKVSKAFAEIGELPFEIYDNAGVTVQDIWQTNIKYSCYGNNFVYNRAMLRSWLPAFIFNCIKNTKSREFNSLLFYLVYCLMVRRTITPKRYLLVSLRLRRHR